MQMVRTSAVKHMQSINREKEDRNCDSVTEIASDSCLGFFNIKKESYWNDSE